MPSQNPILIHTAPISGLSGLGVGVSGCRWSMGFAGFVVWFTALFEEQGTAVLGFGDKGLGMEHNGL